MVGDDLGPQAKPGPALAQYTVELGHGEVMCYTAGSVAGAVLGTLAVTLVLAAAAYLVWRVYWRSRRGKHLVLVTDPEGAGDQFAFDNPCFKDGTPIGRTTMEKEPAKLDQKGRWSPWGALVGPRTTDKRRALDDSFVGEPQVNVVALRSHDFTGLGFNICGNMRDGIFVKDVLHHGPASESGRITPGDRIDSIRISFRHMVFEDALTILSYASPYDVQLEVENASNSHPSTLIRTKRTSGSSIAPADRICHPFYRSQSIADLAQIGKASLKRMQQMGGLGKSPRADDSGDYPTLKLSTSPADDRKKDNTKLEKTAPISTSIVKPERAKKSPTKTSPSPGESPTQEDTLTRFQKFGVRVLPDPAATHRSSHVTSESTDRLLTELKESEHKQNEQNSIIEKVGEGIQQMDEVRHKQYDERGIDIGPVEPTRSRPKSPQNLQPRTDEMQSDSNVKNLLSKGLQNLKEKLHPNEKRSNLESPGGSEHEDIVETAEDDSVKSRSSHEGEIPTEIPEEVRRAAMAARSNRKSSGGNLTAELSVRTSDGGSSSEGDDNNSDSLGRTPKRPNKRKAPPPPPEDVEEKEVSPEPSPQPESERLSAIQQKQKIADDEDNIQMADDMTSLSTIASLVVNPDVTSITIEGTTNKVSEGEGSPDTKLKHMDYDIGVNVNSDSDSDTGEDKKAKKGGTTIELNSSHITIHHSPSSELDNESTRKAASLGDLSRLDSEQPMSILERAVSLDLADGGTPHGSKKRKAPLPPPGEDYLGTPEGEEGMAHRKEPRLDSAMDTFQRRRLKKSSDWGTLEEALMQSEVQGSRNSAEEVSSGPESLEQKTVLCITPEPVTIASSLTPQQPTSLLGLVSSTPLLNNESLQSPLVTSSQSGVSSVHVVSSTTHDFDTSSLTDPFITAVDSTTITELTKTDEQEYEAQDCQPPELPTSPVPVLSSFKPSPSMTYITEIQVVTSADSSLESAKEEKKPSTVAQRVLKYNMETESEATEPEAAHQRGNVSVTAIRSSASRIPTRIATSLPPVTIASNILNHVTEEKRVKPARPPVPPRKSDASAISMEGNTRIQTCIPTESIHISSSTPASGAKFISFSSLTPTSSENGASRNSTSFEQWVFLDESAATTTPNGLESTITVDDSTANPLPTRSQSVTHIVLDSQHSNGKP